MMIEFSHTNSHVKDNLTKLSLASFTFSDLVTAFSKPKVTLDKLSVGYIVRCIINGTRNDKNAEDTASLLFLDGDERIDTTTGEIISGAVNPWEVHLVLNHLGINHLIYTSHSNDNGLHKYRVLIPCHYTRQQLPALLDWIFERLHENEVMLKDAKENRTWAQAWFKPSVHPERQHLFKTFWRVDGNFSNGLREDTEIEFKTSECFWVERIYRDWLTKQEPQSLGKNKVTTLSQVQAKTPIDGLMEICPIAEFKKAYSIHDVLTQAGYKFIQRENKYLSPNSKSGIAGVNVLDNGLIYSHHDDVLKVSRAIDAFECFVLLFCNGDKNKAKNWNPEITKHNQRIYRKRQELKTVKPHDISINAASMFGVKLTPNESISRSQFANSID